LLLTTTTSNRSRPDGGQTRGLGLNLAPVMPKGRSTDPAVVAKIYAYLQERREDYDKGLLTLRQVAEQFGVAFPVVRLQAARLEFDVKPGRQRGSGMKGPERRKQRGLSLSPEVWAMVEADRRAGESINDAVERILRGALNQNN